jgi:hypothetical protein
MVQTVLARFPGQQFKSGFRTPDENRRVGGAPNSDHLTSNAADFAPGSDAVAAFLRGYEGIKQVLWQVAGHFDHVHGAVGGSGKSILGRIGDVVGDVLQAGTRVLFAPIKAVAEAALNRLPGGDNTLGLAVRGIGFKVLEGIESLIKPEGRRR